MNIEIIPDKLSGKVKIPPSKSVAHRMIIAASFAKGRSVITNLYPSADILATIGAMKALGAGIDFSDGKAVIDGITNPPERAVIDCRESGSTLRFLIPVACALGTECTFIGRAKLPTRPITPFLEQFPKHGIEFDMSKAKDGEYLPCTVKGKLTGGVFEIDGSLSSQFITGLLLALPMLDTDSEIRLTSKLSSKPYVDITLGVLEEFGCEVKATNSGFIVKGNCSPKPHDTAVEGDYSQAAFFYVANALGSDVKIGGLNVNSFQGDKKIVEICSEIVYNNNGGLHAFTADCSDIPDLAPILTVLGCFCEGKSYITNAARLRYKECDRIAVMAEVLNAVGGKVTEREDGLEIEGVGCLKGGRINAHVDHRVAMAMAIAATRSENPIIIEGAECVSKSYPDFFEVYKSLGGIIKESME